MVEECGNDGDESGEARTNIISHANDSLFFPEEGEGAGLGVINCLSHKY
jgi:hypothetical protein